MLGGGLNGGKIMGEYPEELSDNSDYWVRRGRMIPTLPFDSVWNGIAEWMGVQGDSDLNFVLPNRVNFDKCSKMFHGHELFKSISASDCINDADGDGVSDEKDLCPNTRYWIDAEVDEFGCQESVTTSPNMSPISIPSSSEPSLLPTSAPTDILPTVPAPVSNPTPSPVSAPSMLPEVQLVGNPCGDQFSDGLCVLCTGDCDRDSDCAGDLICFQRSGGEDVPGCAWGSNSATLKAEGHDYCKLFYHYYYCVIVFSTSRC